MTQFQDMMQRARKAAEEGDWSPEPGNHDAVVVEGDAFESKAGDVYAKTRLELRTPGHPDAGKHWDHLMGFRTPQQQEMSVSQLSTYGLTDEEIDNLEDVDDLARSMAELVGTEVEVSCKARDNGDGVWTNIQGAQSARALVPEVPADAGGLGSPRDSKPPDDDDVPF